eukprot:8723862-Pyramimonas_sp.AAC.1
MIADQTVHLDHQDALGKKIEEMQGDANQSCRKEEGRSGCIESWIAVQTYEREGPATGLGMRGRQKMQKRTGGL